MSLDSTQTPSSEITEPMRENPRCPPSLLLSNAPSRTLVDKAVGTDEEIGATQLRLFRCPYCVISFKRLYNLETHIETHNKVDQAVDGDKVSTYLISPFAEAQMAPVERPFKCPLCPFSSVRNHNLKIHFQVHNYKAAKRFGCHICGHQFSRKHDLRRHRELHRMSSSSDACSVSCRSFDLRPDLPQYRPLLSLHLEANRLRRHFFPVYSLPPMPL